MAQRIDIQPDTSALTLGIVTSRYHGWATEPLLKGAIDRFNRLGGHEENLILVPAPGTWEIPAIALALAEWLEIDAVVALGVVLRGETPHFDFICRGVTDGLREITAATGVPVGFGVLTCDTSEQVKARCGGEMGNKGAEAMSAAVEAALAIMAIQQLDRGEG